MKATILIKDESNDSKKTVTIQAECQNDQEIDQILVRCKQHLPRAKIFGVI